MHLQRNVRYCLSEVEETRVGLVSTAPPVHPPRTVACRSLEAPAPYIRGRTNYCL